MVADAGRNSEAVNALGSTFTKSGKAKWRLVLSAQKRNVTP